MGGDEKFSLITQGQYSNEGGQQYTEVFELRKENWAAIGV